MPAAVLAEEDGGGAIGLAGFRGLGHSAPFKPLTPDLSLPRIQERFTPETVSPDTTDSERPEHPTMSSAPASARRTATHAAWAALLVLDQGGDDGAAAAQIAATGEVLDALAKTSSLHTRDELRQAAWEFERASRSHTRAEFRYAQVCAGRRET
ncbi:hypothetical protein [Streptomyces pathocidini]